MKFGDPPYKGPVIIYGRGGERSQKWGGVENILRFKE